MCQEEKPRCYRILRSVWRDFLAILRHKMTILRILQLMRQWAGCSWKINEKLLIGHKIITALFHFNLLSIEFMPPLVAKVNQKEDKEQHNHASDNFTNDITVFFIRNLPFHLKHNFKLSRCPSILYVTRTWRSERKLCFLWTTNIVLFSESLFISFWLYAGRHEGPLWLLLRIGWSIAGWCKARFFWFTIDVKRWLIALSLAFWYPFK